MLMASTERILIARCALAQAAVHEMEGKAYQPERLMQPARL